MEALRLQEAQPQMSDERIVHVLTMPKYKRTYKPIKVTPIDNRKIILTGALNWGKAKPLENSCVWAAISGHLEFGNELKETLWTAYGPKSDRFLDLDTRKKYFYKQYKTAVEVYKQSYMDAQKKSPGITPRLPVSAA